MAGTYYPPMDAHGQPGFSRLLLAMADAWRTQRSSVVEQSEQIAQSVGTDTSFVNRLSPTRPRTAWRVLTRSLADHLVAQCDADGGFGPAPKFPRASFVEALIADGRRSSYDAATVTLNAMSRRGLYDHLAGGFARYSVDAQWHVPHFEKMLSDQALLATAYLRADRATSGTTEWRDVAINTLRFVVRDLSVPTGLAASLDADSAGHEGAHATWTRDEVKEALGIELVHYVDEVCDRWRIDSVGKFEGRSIPRLKDDASFITPEHLQSALEALRTSRARRPQPSRDDKVVLEWNAMFAVAALESRDEALEQYAFELLQGLANSHFRDGTWWRTQSQRARATAADLAWLIEAQVSAFELSGDDAWLDAARISIDYLVAHFWDGPIPSRRAPQVGGGFFSTSDEVDDLFTRPKEIFDGATPSAHATAATALARYALARADDAVMLVSERLIELAGTLLSDHPSAVPDLLRAYGFVSEGREIVVPGARSELSDLVRSSFVPSSVIISGSGASSLLDGRSNDAAYICRQRVCQLPARDVLQLDRELDQLNDREPW
jgi:uncharacterized protein YyaL (SSP411 family)